MLAGHLSHFNDISTRVSPVQVSSHPVHRNTTRHFQLFDLDMSRQGVFVRVVYLHWYDGEFVFSHIFKQPYLQVGDSALTLPSVTVRVRGG